MNLSQGENVTNNIPIIPSTPPTNTWPLQPTTLLLNTPQNLFSTPRCRKQVTLTSTPNAAKPWPRIGKKIPTETLLVRCDPRVMLATKI